MPFVASDLVSNKGIAHCTLARVIERSTARSTRGEERRRERMRRTERKHCPASSAVLQVAYIHGLGLYAVLPRLACTVHAESLPGA
jgi:hypothetical protein